VAVLGVGSLLVVGVALAGIGAAGQAAAAEDAADVEASVATAPVVRRAIQSSEQLDGTLGFAGAVTITNWLETTSDNAGGSTGGADEAYLAAKAQYDTAVANRALLRNPTAADIARARATLAQAQAALRTAQQADDGPTAAQRAAARSAVTQAEENRAAAAAQLKSAEAALADCTAALAPAAPPAPDGTPASAAPCDPTALAAAVDRAESDVRVRRAQLKAAEAALAGLDDVQPNAGSNITAARAGVTAAAAALDALRNPTTAKLRLADDAVATARANLEDAERARNLPGGIVTMVPDEGAILGPGDILYTLDGTHAVVLLEGAIPAWRSLEPAAADGPDIGQLERSLAALGFGFENVEPDEHWDDDTTDAVLALQAGLGTTADGTLELGEVVFAPAGIRVSAVMGSLGSTIRREAKVMTATSTEREVTVELEADRQAIVEVGAGVTVERPDGTVAPGTIAAIGTVATVAATAGAADATPTVTVTIRLDDPGTTGTLDGAPVTVNVVRERRENVLAVPVSALLALAEGGYAVEVVGAPGVTHLVGVETGLFEDGFVEVRSAGLDESMQVVVPS
jgi:multidrug efflux pump subunit AcrA (membrane-fusion protein)